MIGKASLGKSDIIAETPEPMKIIASENSRALDDLTSTARGSSSAKSRAYSDLERTDATAQER